MKIQTLVLGLVLLTVANNAYAEQYDSPRSNPEATFKNVFSVESVQSEVPVVVAVPVYDNLLDGRSVLVRERETGKYIGSYIHKTYSKPLIKNTVSTEPFAPQSYFLVDGYFDKGVDFEVPAEGKGEVKIIFKATESVTTSQLNLNLDRYVSLPLTVKVTSGMQAQSLYKTLVSETRLTSTIVNFPEVTADYFEVTFTYVQPLRINELNFVQKTLTNTEKEVRFLAQPNNSYEIYLNPDTTRSIPTTEAGNLSSDEGVLALPAVVRLLTNYKYIPADIDEDGVPDLVDNCVRVMNTDQIDVDSNGRGDACDDFDRDGRINSIDNCVNQPNAYQADEDGDGIGDVCDAQESRFTERNTWVPWVGIGSAVVVLLILFALVAKGIKPEDEVSLESVADEVEG